VRSRKECGHPCVAVRCSVLQGVVYCVAVRCSTGYDQGRSAIVRVLQCVTVYWSVLQCVAVCCSVLQYVAVHCSMEYKQGKGAVIRSLQCVAVCCSVLQRVAAFCSVLQRVVVCCRVLQCVALRRPIKKVQTKNSHYRGGGHILRQIATHYKRLQHTNTHCKALHNTATHCSALQHTATLRHTRSNHRAGKAVKISESGE